MQSISRVKRAKHPGRFGFLTNAEIPHGECLNGIHTVDLAYSAGSSADTLDMYNPENLEPTP